MKFNLDRLSRGVVGRAWHHAWLHGHLWHLSTIVPLLHHHHHLHLLIHLHLGLVGGLHGLAHLLGTVLLVPWSNAAEEDDAWKAAAEDNDSYDDCCDDAARQGLAWVDSLARLDPALAPVALTLASAVTELTVASVTAYERLVAHFKF